MKHDNIPSIYTYMRCHAALLGERILQEYPALHQFGDAVSPRIEGLLRTLSLHRPSPSWEWLNAGKQARTSMVVAECGTGKTRSRSERSTSTRRRYVYCLSDGSGTPRRKVGSGNASDVAGAAHVPGR